MDDAADAIAAAAKAAAEAEIARTRPDDFLRCRFYAQKYPDVDDVVVVQVQSIAEMGAYVTLLEYDNIEGMILLSELSRRRIRSINKLIRVGRIEFVMVLRVDAEKGYIDLSKRRVAPEDIGKAEDRYNKAKAVHSILRYVADKHSVPLKQLYAEFAWPLYGRFKHAYDGMKLCITDPDSVMNAPDVTLSDELKAVLLKNIQERLTPQPVRVRADVEVTCFAYEGIDAIKAALHAGIATGDENHPIKVKLLSPPQYIIWCTSLDRDEGLAAVNAAIAKIKEVITEKGGSLGIKTAARSVSDREDAELSTILRSPEDEDPDDDSN